MLDGMIATNTKIIASSDGSVMHGLKYSDNGFISFEEVYFSTVKCQAVKAWKYHKKMTLNLLVPVGKVLFVFYDNRKGSSTYKNFFKLILSQSPYNRVTVPPKIWFGFKGMNQGINLICNVSNLSHDPNELIRKNVDEIQFDWNT